MAVTRREFVTTLGLLAGAVGMGQSDLAKVVEVFGLGGTMPVHDGTGKPKVIWVHGAECTGCSTSLLSLYEDASGIALPAADNALGKDVSTVTALGIAGGIGIQTTGDAVTQLTAAGYRTLNTAGLNVDGSALAINIADVLIDFIDLQYHETVMGMGGDSAYAYLANEMASSDATPFVLVVEGAVQATENTGYWNKSGNTPWCAIAKDGTPGANVELSFDDVVEDLATRSACKAVVAIGQCACFGGYPGCIGPDLVPLGNGATTRSQTGAKGVYDFLVARGYVAGGSHSANPASQKVINVPGCPANPWWFTLSVVAWLVEAATGPTQGKNGALGILDKNFAIVGGVDNQRRLTAVYGHLLHGKYCPRYPDYAARKFVSRPGEYVAGSAAGGCLKNIGCKGLSTMSLCGRHGWNNAQPENAALNADSTGTTKAGEVPPLYKSTDGTTPIGGFCMTAGAPCMGCTEKGYPDAFTPFVTR